jgi:hypothetical protein
MYKKNMAACSFTDVPDLSELECVFKVVIQNLLSLASIVFFVMILYGGFQYITSGGNPESTGHAQKILTYAVFGLIAAALAYMVLVLIQYVTGANVTEFKFY